MEFIKDVIKLDVFDDKGKFVTSMKSLNKGDLFYSGYDSSYLLVKDVSFDLNLLKAIGEYQYTASNNDFDNALRDKKDVIIFNKNNNKGFKLIGYGETVDEEENLKRKFKVVIPSSRYQPEYKLETKSLSYVSHFRYAFYIEPYNEYGDLFKLIFE